MIFDFNKACSIDFCEDSFTENYKTAELYVIFTQDNCINVLSDDINYTLQKQSVMLSAKNIYTDANNSGYYLFGVSGSIITQIKNTLFLPQIFIVQDCHAVKASIMNIVFASEHNATEQHKSECVFKFLCSLQSAFDKKKANTTSTLVSLAINEIHENFNGIYGVEELSEYLGVSKNHLVRTFSKEMGQSPGKYLTLTRLSYAKQLLLNRDYSLEIIAVMCGFSNSNYFCKVFKKYEGISPTQYRLNTKNNNDLPLEYEDFENALYV